MLAKEVRALKDIEAHEKFDKYIYPYDYIPRVKAKGIFIHELPAYHPSSHSDPSSNFESGSESKQLKSFYVLPQYGLNLEKLFENSGNCFSSKTILQLGVRLLEIIEQIHDSGYTYNDLKLDNILVGDQHATVGSLHQIRLVDFGFAERFRSPDGGHFDQQELQVFRGNMIFASPTQFDFKTTSRRDDLISLCYLLVFLFKGSDVPFISHD
jgi:serine/threonine protein kinase